MSFAALSSELRLKSTMRSLDALIREAQYELRQLGDAHAACATFTDLLAGSNAFRPMGWFQLKRRARLAVEALEQIDARVAFTLLLDRLDQADTPSSLGMSADVIILEEEAYLDPRYLPMLAALLAEAAPPAPVKMTNKPDDLD